MERIVFKKWVFVPKKYLLFISSCKGCYRTTAKAVPSYEYLSMHVYFRDDGLLFFD